MPETVAVDTSGSLGSALSGIAGTMAREIPGALAEDKANRAIVRDTARATVGAINQGTREREAMKPPPTPPPNPPPQYQETSMGDKWGSLAMGMAVLGSAFTRRPATNSLNAAAGVLNAYHDSDAAAYKRNFDNWKAQTDYSLKMYEYQREAYKDAISNIKENSNDAMAKLRVVASAFGDDALKHLTSIGNVAGAVAKIDEFNARLPLLRTETAIAERRLGLVNDFNAARDAWKANPNDPVARQRMQAVIDESKTLRTIESGVGSATDQKLESETDLFNRAKAEKESKLGRPLNTAEEIETRKEVHGGFGGAAGQQHVTPPHEYEVRDKEGKVIRSFTGQASTSSVGAPIDMNTGKPVVVDAAAGETVHLGKPGGEGRQAATAIGRLIGASTELVPSLKNLVALPVNASAGPFMGLQLEKPGDLRSAIARTAAGQLSGEMATAVAQQFTGVQRQLATIESQGAATGLVGLTNANNVLVPQPGWSGTSVMRSYAEIRQIAEANIRAMLSSPYVQKEQKELLRQLRDEFKEAVPYSVQDVNQLAFGNKKKFKESVSSFADKILQNRTHAPASGEAAGTPASTLPAEQPPTEGVAEGSVWREGPGGKVLGVLRGGKWAAP